MQVTLNHHKVTAQNVNGLVCLCNNVLKVLFLFPLAPGWHGRDLFLFV